MVPAVWWQSSSFLSSLEPDLCILPAVVKENDKALIHITNSTNACITLYANTKIAEAYPMDNEEDMPELESDVRSKFENYTLKFNGLQGTAVQLSLLETVSEKYFTLRECIFWIPREKLR
jgi:hypothetical protein